MNLRVDNFILAPIIKPQEQQIIKFIESLGYEMDDSMKGDTVFGWLNEEDLNMLAEFTFKDYEGERVYSENIYYDPHYYSYLFKEIKFC